MTPVAYFTLGVAPIIALFIYLYFRKHHDAGFAKILFQSFIAGSAGVLLLLFGEYIAMKLGLNVLASIKRLLFFSFITLGATSELGKFIMFRYVILPKNHITRPLDAITVSVMISLGFSCVALIMFMFNLHDIQTLLPATLYPFVFVPANIIFAVIMGFFVGMSRLMKARIVFSLTGLLGAAFFHGIFNLCLVTNDFKLLSLFSFGSTLIVLFLGLKAAFSNQIPSEQ